MLEAFLTKESQFSLFLLFTLSKVTLPMKKTLLLLPTILICLGTFNSCGDAGVQVRIGDQFETEFSVVNFLLTGLVSGSETTTIRQDLLDYGDFITDLDINSLVLGFEGVDAPFEADLTLTFANQSRTVVQNVDIPNIQILNSTQRIIDASELDFLAIANILQNDGEIIVSHEVSSTDPDRLDFFDINLTFEVFATVQAD